jgi:hypothetical protein
MGKRLMITIEQNGERLKDTEADIDRDIARVVKAVLDDVRWEDRSRPLSGIVIRIDEIRPESCAVAAERDAEHPVGLPSEPEFAPAWGQSSRT